MIKNNFMIGSRLVLTGLLVFSLCLSWSYDVNAQEEGAEEQQEEKEPIRAEAGKDRNVKVGQKVLFDGSGSFNPLEGDLKYTWDFGDDFWAEGEEVTHVYWKGGDYEVRLTIDNGVEKAEDTVVVSVSEDIVILIADHTVSKDEIKSLQERVKEKGVLIVPVTVPRGEPSDIIEEKLRRRFLGVQEEVKKAELIVTWTKEGAGLNTLIGIAQDLEREYEEGGRGELGISNKGVVNLVKGDFWSVRRMAEATQEVLKPSYVTLLHEDDIEKIFKDVKADKFIGSLEEQGVNFEVIKKPKSTNVTRYNNLIFRLENYLIGRGVPVKTLLLIMFLPIIATIIAVARAVFGIKAFGIFVPTIISLSLIAVGLKYGLTVFVAVLVVATVMRFVMRRLRFLYLPRIALVLTAIALTMLAMLWAGAGFERYGFITVSIFPLLVMVTLMENFVSIQIDKGLGAATRLTLETLALAVVGYLLANWGLFKVLVLGYPTIILLLVVIVNLVFGKFKGLRIGEYFRFKEVMKNV